VFIPGIILAWLGISGVQGAERLRLNIQIACRKAIARADAYVDRELAAEERGRIQRHLVGCENCSAVVVERDRLKARVQRSVQAIRAPAGLIWDLQAQLGRF
jgi:putative zinc finger protein